MRRYDRAAGHPEDRARSLEESTFTDLWTLVVECSSILKEIAPIKRRPWLRHVVEEMYREQNGRCGLCNDLMEFDAWEIDHKIPSAYGGGNERTDLQLAHTECNRQKRSSVDPHDLLEYLQDRYMNR